VAGKRGIVIVVAVALAVVLTVGSCTNPVIHPGTPSPSPSAALITVPNVVGQNAAVALDKLKNLGFTDIDLGTVDGRLLVLLPANWTVKTQSAVPGTRLAADAKIVLGCSRNGSRFGLADIVNLGGRTAG
jgi:hypothetical protein